MEFEKFSQEQVLQMIQLYKKHDCLWNTSSKKYRKKDLKQKAWRDIALELEIEEKVVRRKLRILRGTYILEQKKIRKRISSDNNYQSRLYWFPSMQFLDAVITERISNDYNITDNVFDDIIEENYSEQSNDDISEEVDTNSIGYTEPIIDSCELDDSEEKSKDEIDVFCDWVNQTLRELDEDESFKFMQEMQTDLMQRRLAKVIQSQTLHESNILGEVIITPIDDEHKTPTKIKKRKPLNYVCPVCGKVIKHNVKLHITTHQNIPYEERPFICELCNKRFVHAEYLRGHMQTHIRARKYQCTYCDDKFLSWISRRMHIAKVHTGEYRFECGYCKKQFWARHQYVRHMRTHTGEKQERKVKCTICGHLVVDKRTLREHMISHSEERNEQCPECDKCYKTKKNLSVHRKIHHPRTVEIINA